MKIGDLWLSIGVKEEASLKKAIKNLSKVGDVAQETVSKLGSAARSMSADWAKIGNITARVGSIAGVASTKLVSGAKAQSSAFKIAAADAQKYGDAVVSSYRRQIQVTNALKAAQRASSFKGAVLPDLAGAVGVRGGIPRLAGAGAVSPVFKKMMSGGGLSGLENFAGSKFSQSPSVNRSRTPGNMALDMLADDLALKTGSGRTSGTVNMRGRGGSGGGGGGTPNVHGSALGSSLGGDVFSHSGGWGGAPKGPGFIGRFRNALSAGGGGGGTKGRRRGGGGGGFGGHGARFGPLGDASAFRRVVMGAGIFQGAQEFGQLADTYARLQMRLEGVTSSQSEANATFNRLREISINTKLGLEDTAEGYVRIKHATAEMKLSNEDTFKLVENLNTLLSTSGASTQEAASGMRQLTQAFAKGKLDGDEFRSIAENMPNILKVLQKSLGVTEGQLRRMSKEGELSRDKLVKALLDVKGLQKPIDTFGSSWQKFKDDLMISFGLFAKEHNLVSDFKDVLKTFGEVLMKYVVPGLGAALKWLKEHETVTKALIGLALAGFFIKVAAAIIAFPINIIMKMVGAYKALALWAGAAKAAMAGGGAAGVAGAAGGAAASAGAKAAKSAGKGVGKSLLRGGGALLGGLAGGPIGWGILGALTVDELTGGGLSDAIMAPTNTLDNFSQYSMLPGVRAQGGGGSVSIGNIDIKIEASDMADVESKMTKELMDRMMRNANPYAGGR